MNAIIINTENNEMIVPNIFWLFESSKGAKIFLKLISFEFFNLEVSCSHISIKNTHELKVLETE